MAEKVLSGFVSFQRFGAAASPWLWVTAAEKMKAWISSDGEGKDRSEKKLREVAVWLGQPAGEEEERK